MLELHRLHSSHSASSLNTPGQSSPAPVRVSFLTDSMSAAPKLPYRCGQPSTSHVVLVSNRLSLILSTHSSRFSAKKSPAVVGSFVSRVCLFLLFFFCWFFSVFF